MELSIEDYKNICGLYKHSKITGKYFNQLFDKYRPCFIKIIYKSEFLTPLSTKSMKSDDNNIFTTELLLTFIILYYIYV